MRKETAMKSGFWHWIQRFLMAEVLILGLALPLLMIRSGGAEEPIVASDGIDPMVETVALDEVGSQETVEITARNSIRLAGIDNKSTVHYEMILPQLPFSSRR